MNHTFNKTELPQIRALVDKVKVHEADPENSPKATWAEVYALAGFFLQKALNVTKGSNLDLTS